MNNWWMFMILNCWVVILICVITLVLVEQWYKLRLIVVYMGRYLWLCLLWGLFVADRRILDVNGDLLDYLHLLDDLDLFNNLDLLDDLYLFDYLYLFSYFFNNFDNNRHLYQLDHNFIVIFHILFVLQFTIISYWYLYRHLQ